MEIDTADSSIKKTYIYANSQIIAQHDGDHTANRYFYQHDRLGNVRQIIKPDGLYGSLANHYTYAPFGELFPTEVSETVSNSFRFTGQFYDSEIAQYYLRARQYDPHLYRFTGRDLIDGKFEEPLTLHKYLYCINDPVNKIDPTGKWWGETHQEFGMWGEGGLSPFDYARLDIDMPPVNPDGAPWLTRYTHLHFMSREDVYTSILSSASVGNISQFEYGIHQWQDSYVHYDRGFRWPFGHAWRPSADDPLDPINIRNNAYERCDYTTTELEKIWFKYNITNSDNPLASWIDNPLAELPDENPWLSFLPYSGVVDSFLQGLPDSPDIYPLIHY